MSKNTILIATPHSRNDNIEKKISEILPDFNVLRIKNRGSLTLGNLEKISPMWIFFPHWSWIIPEIIHKNYSCVIFHMTDVPYGRGGSPLQNLIVRGHKSTMLSALKCQEHLDSGPVYLKKALSLEGTAETILQRASLLIPEMIREIVLDPKPPNPQTGLITNFTRRVPQNGEISELDMPEKVFDYIRMLDGDGYPPAFVEVGNLIIEFKNAIKIGNTVETSAVIKVKK